MTSEADSTTRSRRAPLPMSPLRAVCVHIAYQKYEPSTLHQPCNRMREKIVVGPEIVDYDTNGLIHGQKLQPHNLKIISLQDEHVFPKCLGRYISFPDEELYPQHGDLKSSSFRRRRYFGENLLHEKRMELIEKMDGYNGIEIPPRDESRTVAWKEIEIVAPLDNELAESMRAQMRKAEETRKAAREAKRAERKTRADWKNKS